MSELLRVENLTIKYDVSSRLFEKKRFFYAVNSISFKIMENEIAGIVGESGSGKSTLIHGIMNLKKISGGNIFYRGKNILEFSKEELKEFRKKAAIIFQDPYSSLNPRKNILTSLTDPPIYHKIIDKKDRYEYAKYLLKEVGLRENILYKYPFEFSGGEKQRISIARAVGMKPEFIICDEPVSSLDLSTQAQILNLLKSIKKKRKISLLFISHDLSVIKYMADFVIVMFRGNIVECAPQSKLFQNPLHPFTKLLLNSIPSFEDDLEEKFINRQLDPKDLKGCNFFSRCPQADERCKNEIPLYYNFEKNHYIRCHLFTKCGNGVENI